MSESSSEPLIELLPELLPEPLIEFRGVSKAFGDKVVLNNINLAIHAGDALAVIGPSGTGKSTILRLIAGLTQPDTGHIYVNGQVRNGDWEEGRNAMRMSMVFQQSALFDSLTVEENVGFHLFENSQLAHSDIKELVSKKLALVGLENMGHLYPAELSGGMRKRVSFARAILDNPYDQDDDPQILLYDEPTAGLDPIASTVIEDMIRNIHATSCPTYVIVTHQHSTIHRTGQRIILLYEGKIRWQGTVTEIETSDDPYLQQFLQGQIHGPIRIIEPPLAGGQSQ